jgi:tetratricopeptide (TPR) repeat protein
MNKPGANLPNIFFISLPETMKTTISGFTVDPSKLLPVEVPPGEEEFRLDNLSWEMILAGMLKILAYEPDHEHAGYYRNFVLSVKPDILNQLEEAGIIKVKNKEFDLAEDIFKALLGLKPMEPAYAINLALLCEERSLVYGGLCKQDLEEYYKSQAFEYHKKALGIDPDFPEACYNAGYFFLRNGNIEKADEYLRRFLDISDDAKKKTAVSARLKSLSGRIRMDGLFKEAFDFIQLGKEEEGIKKIKVFLEENPDYANAWFLLGWAHRRLKQYDKGRDAFLRSLDLDTPHVDTLNELSICLMELDDFEGCRNRLIQALEMEPDNTKILSNLAILSLKEHREGDAAAIFTEVLKIDPDDPIATQYLSYLQNP